MSKDDEIHLLHMLDAAREAVAFARGRTQGDLPELISLLEPAIRSGRGPVAESD